MSAVPLLLELLLTVLQRPDPGVGGAVPLALRSTAPGRAVMMPSSAQARRLERAAASLGMGRDLLGTHFSIDGKGRRWPRSEWADAITCEAVTGALLTEIAWFARQAADQCSALAAPPSPMVARGNQARRRLNAACQWLWVLEASAGAVHQHAAGGAGRELLPAIPGEHPAVAACATG